MQILIQLLFTECFPHYFVLKIMYSLLPSSILRILRAANFKRCFTFKSCNILPAERGIT